jgi:hypothetical protein
MQVAEVLHEIVYDRGVRFGVPTLVLAEAMLAASTKAERLWLRLTRRHDLAAAARASMVHEAPVLSSGPDVYEAGPGIAVR